MLCCSALTRPRFSFPLRHPRGSIDVVDFKLEGDDAHALGCTAQSPAWPNPAEVATCGSSKYRFSLHPGRDGSEFGLRVYHELGTAYVWKTASPCLHRLCT